MDATMIKARDNLRLNDMQVEAFKAIYDFISRFAGVCQASWNQDIILHSDWELRIQEKRSGEIVDIPKETMKIIAKIGTKDIWKYFSPMEYPKRFEGFCEKLLATGRVDFRDYVANGLIVFKDKKESSYEVKEVLYEDDGLFGMREAS